MFLSMHGCTLGRDGEEAGYHVQLPRNAPHLSPSQSLLSDCNRGQWRPKSSSSPLRFRLNVGIHPSHVNRHRGARARPSHPTNSPVCPLPIASRPRRHISGPDQLALLILDSTAAAPFSRRTHSFPPHREPRTPTSHPNRNLPPDRPPCSPPPPARQPPSRVASSPSPDRPPPRRPSSAPSLPPRHNSSSHGP